MTKPKRRKKDYTLYLLISPTVFIAIISTILMYLYLPTEISIDLTVNSVDFTTSDTGPSLQLTNPITIQSITVDHFDGVSLNPIKLEVADPSQYRFEGDSFPDSAWTSIPVGDRGVRIVGNDPTASYDLTIEGTEPMKLDRIWVNPGAKVTLAKRGEKITNLSIALEEQESNMVLTPHEGFEIITTNSRIEGMKEMLYKADSITYRATLPDHTPLITITGQKAKPFSLFLNIEISPGQNLNQVLARKKIPVETITFSKQDSMGNPETTLLKGKDAIAGYPGYPEIDKKIISYTELLSLGDLREFFVEKIYLDPGSNGIGLLVRGVAGNARAGKTDLRLSCFQSLWHNRKLTALFGIIAWVFPTSVGIYKFLKRKG